MKQIIRDWWDGAYVPPPRDPYIMMMGHYERHWTSRLAHTLAAFWMKYWQWCFSAAFTVTGLIIAAMKL